MTRLPYEFSGRDYGPSRTKHAGAVAGLPIPMILPATWSTIDVRVGATWERVIVWAVDEGDLVCVEPGFAMTPLPLRACVPLRVPLAKCDADDAPAWRWGDGGPAREPRKRGAE